MLKTLYDSCELRKCATDVENLRPILDKLDFKLCYDDHDHYELMFLMFNGHAIKSIDPFDYIHDLINECDVLCDTDYEDCKVADIILELLELLGQIALVQRGCENKWDI